MPVIALTARSRKEDRERCLVAGMDEFLTKPVAPAELLTAIGRLLRSHAPLQIDQVATLDLLDARLLLERCGGDAVLLEKLCRSLQAQAPKQMAELRSAVRERDAKRLQGAAHRLCGMLSEFSTVAADLAGNLEDLAAGEGLEKTGSLLYVLETMAERLYEQVDGLSVDRLRAQAGQ